MYHLTNYNNSNHFTGTVRRVTVALDAGNRRQQKTNLVATEAGVLEIQGLPIEETGMSQKNVVISIESIRAEISQISLWEAFKAGSRARVYLYGYFKNLTDRLKRNSAITNEERAKWNIIINCGDYKRYLTEMFGADVVFAVRKDMESSVPEAKPKANNHAGLAPSYLSTALAMREDIQKLPKKNALASRTDVYVRNLYTAAQNSDKSKVDVATARKMEIVANTKHYNSRLAAKRHRNILLAAAADAVADVHDESENIEKKSASTKVSVAKRIEGEIAATHRNFWQWLGGKSKEEVYYENFLKNNKSVTSNNEADFRVLIKNKTFCKLVGKGSRNSITVKQIESKLMEPQKSMEPVNTKEPAKTAKKSLHTVRRAQQLPRIENPALSRPIGACVAPISDAPPTIAPLAIVPVYPTKTGFQGMAQIVPPRSLDFPRGAPTAGERSVLDICELSLQGSNKAENQNAKGLSQVHNDNGRCLAIVASKAKTHAASQSSQQWTLPQLQKVFDRFLLQQGKRANDYSSADFSKVASFYRDLFNGAAANMVNGGTSAVVLASAVANQFPAQASDVLNEGEMHFATPGKDNAPLFANIHAPQAFIKSLVDGYAQKCRDEINKLNDEKIRDAGSDAQKVAEAELGSSVSRELLNIITVLAYLDISCMSYDEALQKLNASFDKILPVFDIKDPAVSLPLPANYECSSFSSVMLSGSLAAFELITLIKQDLVSLFCVDKMLANMRLAIKWIEANSPTSKIKEVSDFEGEVRFDAAASDPTNTAVATGGLGAEIPLFGDDEKTTEISGVTSLADLPSGASRLGEEVPLFGDDAEKTANVASAPSVSDSAGVPHAGSLGEEIPLFGDVQDLSDSLVGQGAADAMVGGLGEEVSLFDNDENIGVNTDKPKSDAHLTKSPARQGMNSAFFSPHKTQSPRRKGVGFEEENVKRVAESPRKNMSCNK